MFTEDVFVQSASCDYPNKGLFTTELDLKVYFSKTTTGKYCAEIKNVKLESWVDFNDSDSTTNKQKVAFDLNNDTINSVLVNQTCPKLKFVNDYVVGSSETTKFTVSDKNMNSAECTASQLASLGSECWVLPGENFYVISNEEMSNAVGDAQSDRDGIGDLDLFGDLDQIDNPTCEMLDESVLKMLSNFYLILEIVGVALFILLNMWTFLQAVGSSEQDKFKGLSKKIIQRAVALAVLLLLPVLLKAIFAALKVAGVEKVIDLCIDQFL